MAGRGSHVPSAALGTSPPGMGVLTLNSTPVSPKKPCPLLPPGLAPEGTPSCSLLCPGPWLCAWSSSFSGFPWPSSKPRPPHPEMGYPASPPQYSVPVTLLSHACHIPVTCLPHACHTPVTHLSSPWHLLCSHQFPVVIGGAFYMQKTSSKGSLSRLKMDIVLVKVQVKTRRRVSFSSADRCDYAVFLVELSNHLGRASE